MLICGTALPNLDTKSSYLIVLTLELSIQERDGVLSKNSSVIQVVTGVDSGVEWCKDEAYLLDNAR